MGALKTMGHFGCRLCYFMGLVIVLMFLCMKCEAAMKRGKHHPSKGCLFPERWGGTWFQKGVSPPIRIEKDIFSFKGKCQDSVGDKFFIEDSKTKCFRCVVIYEKHHNVLQYRETFCDAYRSLDHACSKLNVDAALYSLFRVDAEPVFCQLPGPFHFSYSRGGHEECKNPVSTIDSCTEDSRLLFRFQACADVMGTESSVEELSCLALWKEGSYQYLVGKMSNKKQHNLPFIDNNAYRCFVFEHLPEKGEFQMSQNSDATCDGLISPWEGSRTMRLVKRKHPTSSCQFPSWVTSLHRWHTLDRTKSYIFSHRNTSFKMTASDQHYTDTKFLCISELTESSNSSMFVTHGMAGCENGYACIRFYRRHRHIIEIQMGQFARSPQEACHSSFYENSREEVITLVASSIESHGCPKFSETDGMMIQFGRSPGFHNEICKDPVMMAVGCQSHDTVRLLITCSTFTDVKNLHCHGHWEEGGKNYLVTSIKHSDKKYCFVYREGDTMTYVSGVHDTCRRTIEPGITGNFSFNISSAGQCDVLLNRSTRPLDTVYIMYLIFAVLVLGTKR